jgi:hypothetical protein
LRGLCQNHSLQNSFPTGFSDFLNPNSGYLGAAAQGFTLPAQGLAAAQGFALPAQGLAAAQGFTLPAQGLAAAQGFALPAQGLAAAQGFALPAQGLPLPAQTLMRKVAEFMVFDLAAPTLIAWAALTEMIEP